MLSLSERKRIADELERTFQALRDRLYQSHHLASMNCDDAARQSIFECLGACGAAVKSTTKKLRDEC